TSNTDDPEAVTRTLAKALDMLDGDYNDLTGFDQISDKLDITTKHTARHTLQGLVDRARQAQHLATQGDEYVAELVWRDLIGDNYPDPEPPSKTAIAGLFKGTASVAGGEVTATSPKHKPVPTRSWRP